MFVNSSCNNCVVNIGKKWTFEMLIPHSTLKLFPIYAVSLNTVFSIPQNQCYPGTPLYYHDDML